MNSAVGSLIDFLNGLLTDEGTHAESQGTAGGVPVAVGSESQERQQLEDHEDDVHRSAVGHIFS